MLKTEVIMRAGSKKMGRLERPLALALICLVTVVCIATLTFLMTRTLSCVRAFSDLYDATPEQSVVNNSPLN